MSCFAVAGGALLLLAGNMGRALFGRDAHGYGRGRAERCARNVRRWPRILAALMAGVMLLAVAGCAVRRLRPVIQWPAQEVLRDQFGAAFGVVLMLFCGAGECFQVWLLPAGSTGAAATLPVCDSRRGLGGFLTTSRIFAGGNGAQHPRLHHAC